MSKYLHFLRDRKKKSMGKLQPRKWQRLLLQSQAWAGDALPCSHGLALRCAPIPMSCVGLGHGPGACSAGEVGGSSAGQIPWQSVTSILGGRDAFCLVWLVSVRAKPGFIGIAAAAHRALFPRGTVPREGQCGAAPGQPCFCRTFLGCSGQGSTDRWTPHQKQAGTARI